MSATKILAENERLYSPVLVAAFVSYGLPPEWGMGIARQESRFNPKAINMTGGDLVRGGSRGICQMSWKTALGLGFTGVPDDLFQPRVCADLAAKLCLELSRRWKTKELLDIAAGYNSGKKFVVAPTSTLSYARNVVAYAAAYKPVAMAIALDLKAQSTRVV